MFKIIFTLAYPFACVCFLCDFFFCNDHQFYWCEPMLKPLVVTRVMETLQCSQAWVGSRTLEYSLKALLLM